MENVPVERKYQEFGDNSALRSASVIAYFPDLSSITV